MKHPNSIGRRIVKAYLLFAIACSLGAAFIAAVVVEGIEARLVDERLMGVAAWAAPRHAGQLPVEMPSGLSFHHGADIPVSLRGLPDGLQEVTVDGIGLHVLSARDSRGPYVVVDHESDYETVEVAVYSMLLLVFLGFIGMSLLLGRSIARGVVTPLVDLAGAVAQRRADLPLQERDDELGILARAFAGHTSELQQFLDRERFFTGDVSHELRTPLTVIAGAAEVVQMDSGSLPATRAAGERICRAALEAAASVDILLQLARAPELIEAEQFDMGALLGHEVARFQPLVAGRPVSLVYGGAGAWRCLAPRRLVSAAVGNLVRNACLYTDQGEVVVRLADNVVEVADTGRGLPAAVMDMLNGRAVSVQRGADGAGLGLALVQRICRHLDATLSVAPQPGGGTVFSLRFNEILTPS